MRNKKRFMALALSAAMIFSQAVPTGMTVVAAEDGGVMKQRP